MRDLATMLFIVINMRVSQYHIPNADRHNLFGKEIKLLVLPIDYPFALALR